MLFFGVAWRGSEAECRSYVEEFDVPYDNALDADEKVFGAYGFNHQPATVFVTRDGRILLKHFGPLDDDEFAEAVDALLEA